jgi:hypothetical protein
VADAGGDDANHHFIVVGLADFQLFNVEFPRSFKNDRSFRFHAHLLRIDTSPFMGCFLIRSPVLPPTDVVGPYGASSKESQLT